MLTTVAYNAPARRESANIRAFHLGGLAVHHWSVRGGSFVYSPWTYQLHRVIAGKTHSQSPILGTKGCFATQLFLFMLWEQ